jgi:hypothetical protein
VSSLGGWVRWIGCAAVWEAGRAVCGERHLRQTQAYALTGPRAEGVDGNIQTNGLGNIPKRAKPRGPRPGRYHLWRRARRRRQRYV